MTKTPWYDRIGWVALILVALGISNWSTTHLTDRLGVPLLPALGFSIVFDVGALLFAHRGLRYVTAHRPIKALGPRLGVMAMVATSALANFANGVMMVHGSAGYILGAFLAAVPVFANAQFESEMKIRFRDTRDSAGLSLPSVDGLAWVFFPRTALRTLQAVVYTRLQAIAEHPDRPGLPMVHATAHRIDETAPMPVIHDDYLPPLEPPDLTELPKSDAVRHVLANRPGANAHQVVALLAAHGVQTSDNYVRKIRAEGKNKSGTVLHLSS